jgi:hypothetical protein
MQTKEISPFQRILCGMSDPIPLKWSISDRPTCPIGGLRNLPGAAVIAESDAVDTQEVTIQSAAWLDFDCPVARINSHLADRTRTQQT